MRGEREIGGLRCSQVLAQLSEYFDGELSELERGRLEAHVRECDHCARFGGVFAAAVRALHAKLRASSLAPAVRERLRARLELPPRRT
jgi:anti-sigma factor (TIGR02949 family)